MLVALGLVTMDGKNRELYDERSFDVRISNLKAGQDDHGDYKVQFVP